MLTYLIIMTLIVGFLLGAITMWCVAYRYSVQLSRFGFALPDDASMTKHEDEAIAMTQEKMGGAILRVE